VETGSGRGPASLAVEVEPRRPFVGQPVLLRVRLIQRAQLAEDPRYAPPSTAGFWSEEASRPESFYADERNRRVLVTETRTRMYPIDAGRTEIGEAVASLALALQGGSTDPLQWLRGRVPRRDLVVRSEPLRVDVRPLPGGGPEGFDGAVGTLVVTWTADREETRADVPLSVKLDIRGVGNLPLIQSPTLASDAFEIFASTTEDSFSAPGTLLPGRRRFVWTALPRHQGRHALAPPRLSWFDPRAERYVVASLPALEVEVGPPLMMSSADRATFPSVFVEHPLDPRHRPAAPWAWAIAGLAIGTGIALWRAASRRPADASERAVQREWLRVVGLARGPDFWRAAEDASAWAERRGRDVHHLRREIASARYGGAPPNVESVRRRLIEHLSVCMPPLQPRWPARAAGAALVASGIVLCVVFGPRPGEVAATVRARVADEAARTGDVERARGEWDALWKEGSRSSALAARLAWAEVREGAIAPAVVWVLRGEGNESRDPSLGWVRERVREAGGLTGAGSGPLPLRRLEWSVLALIAGIAGGVVWPRHVASAAFGATAIALAAVVPLERAWDGHVSRGVVAEPAQLEGPDLRLDPGQVVRVVEKSAERARVAVGQGVEGWLPSGALLEVRAP
jgi:hypothetical protein